MNRKEKIYMARLAKCSMKELISIRDYVSAHKGNMRFASMWVFRRSRKPEDHRYLHNLRAFAGECWHLMVTGDFF